MSITDKVKRSGHLVGAAAFAFAVVAAVVPAQANAYAGMGARSIQMSDTSNGAVSSYQVNFTTVTTATVGSVTVEFCSNSPIIGDTCTAPTGLDTNEATTLGVSGQTGTIGTLAEATETTVNKVVLSTTPASAAAGAQSVTLTGIKNPTNTNVTFYAKIYTHAGTTGGTDTTSIDAGGVALSTNAQLSLTAKVQETLTFCVYTDANCAAGGTAVTLGDSNGVLANTALDYEDTAKFDLASNALNGVVVKLKGNTLQSGSNSITATTGPCATDSTTTSVEQFGMRVIEGTGHVVASSYDCGANAHAFETGSTNTTYGQQIVNTAGATDSATSTLEFSAKSAGTTEAGIYTSTLTLIATATY